MHYGHPAEPNGELVARNAIRLIDMGAEYHGYTADITCSYPENGKFTEDQKTIYNAVWVQQLHVIKRCWDVLSVLNIRICFVGCGVSGRQRCQTVCAIEGHAQIGHARYVGKNEFNKL